MYEHPLEDIHRLIDSTQVAIRRIEAAPTNSIQVNRLPELSEVVLELLGWTNTAYVQNELGINSTILNKFVKMRGVVNKNVARQVADRLRSYLKSQDQKFPEPAVREAPTQLSQKKDVAPLTVSAEQWVTVKLSSDIKMKIGAIGALLDSIIEQTSRTNAPDQDQILTQIERQQLIAILETALNVLKSPLVEKGILRKAQSVLKKGAESAAEKGVQQGLGRLMEGAGARIAELIGSLFN
jgi:hypothetical protein